MDSAKQKYFNKIYDNAKEIECACGCGGKLKNKDKYGRDKKFINGHNGRKYDDPTQYKREWNHRNRKARYESKQERGWRIKAELIKAKGGKCAKCPEKYDGSNACIFEFHHRNPKTKLFNITVRTVINYKRALVEKELKKCDLLCSNCHSKEHAAKY
jgi:hypothetical protein